MCSLCIGFSEGHWELLEAEKAATTSLRGSQVSATVSKAGRYRSASSGAPAQAVNSAQGLVRTGPDCPDSGPNSGTERGTPRSDPVRLDVPGGGVKTHHSLPPTEDNITHSVAHATESVGPVRSPAMLAQAGYVNTQPGAGEAGGSCLQVTPGDGSGLVDAALALMNGADASVDTAARSATPHGGTDRVGLSRAPVEGGSTLTGPKPARARGGLIGLGRGLSPAEEARRGRAAPQGTASGNHSTPGGSNVPSPAVQAGAYGMLPPGMGSQPWGGPPGFYTRPPHPQAFMGQYPMAGAPPPGFWPNMNPPYMNHSGFQQYPGLPGWLAPPQVHQGGGSGFGPPPASQVSSYGGEESSSDSSGSEASVLDEDSFSSGEEPPEQEPLAELPPSQTALGDLTSDQVTQYIDEMAVSLGLARQETATVDVGVIKRGFGRKAEPTTKGWTLPSSIRDRWVADGLGKVAGPPLGRLLPNRRALSFLRVSEEDFEDILRVPSMDEDVAAMLPGTSTTPFSTVWEERLRMLDAQVRALTRINAFQLLTLNHAADHVRKESKQQRAVHLAAALAATAMDESLNVSSRLTTLRRANAGTVLQGKFPDTLLSELNSVPTSATTVFGGALEGVVEKVAARCEQTRSIRSGLATAKASKGKARAKSSSGKRKRRSKDAPPTPTPASIALPKGRKRMKHQKSAGASKTKKSKKTKKGF